MTALTPQPLCTPWGKGLYAALRSGRPPASLRPMLPNRLIHHLPGRQRSERLTGALLDRLTHHVHILAMNGDSYRLKQSKARRSA